MSLDSMQDRLTALQETTGQLKELIDGLASAGGSDDDIPSADSGGVVFDGVELNAEIGQLIREEEDELELLQEEIEDLGSSRPGIETEHQKLRLKEGVERVASELQGYRVSFRKAQILAKQNLHRSRWRERQATLESFKRAAETPFMESDARNPDRLASPPRRPRSNPEQQESLLSQEDQQTVSASHSVTYALREMHNMMAAELCKSEFAQQTLEESTAVMKQLGEDYGSLGDLVSSSANLIGVLVRSQKSDTWYLQTSLYMLVATLAWLVFRRWFYGPLWWLVWLPLKLLVGGSWTVGKAVYRAAPPAEAPTERHAVAGHQHVTIEGLPDGALPTLGVVPDLGSEDVVDEREEFGGEHNGSLEIEDEGGVGNGRPEGLADTAEEEKDEL